VTESVGGKRWGLPLIFLNSLLIFTHKELFDRFSNKCGWTHFCPPLDLSYPLEFGGNQFKAESRHCPTKPRHNVDKCRQCGLLWTFADNCGWMQTNADNGEEKCLT
jgi:hypothetical protein